MPVKERQNSTGWDSVDTLLLETEQAVKEYETVKRKVDLAHSSFKPKRPSLLKATLKNVFKSK